MLRDVVSYLDYSNFDKVAVVIFAACFAAIIWGTLKLRPEASKRFSQIPLTDAVVDPRADAKTN